MNFEQIDDALVESGETIILHSQKVYPEDLGLDKRSAHRLWVGCNYIACLKSQDRSLQYYGGFEYVEETHRREAGDVIIYSALDDRVAKSLSNLKDKDHA